MTSGKDWYVTSDSKDPTRIYTQVLADVITHKPNVDPRIEELVKQAESIKPGSGADVRKVLQQNPNAGDTIRIIKSIRTTDEKTDAVQKTFPYAITNGAGKIVINFSNEPGKEISLDEQKLRKVLKDLNLQLPVPDLQLPVPDLKVLWKVPPMPQEASKETIKSPEATWSRKGKEISDPARGQNEMDTLRRQIERMSAELDALKQRLDSGKSGRP